MSDTTLESSPFLTIRMTNLIYQQGITDVYREFQLATTVYPKFNSAHEGYGVLLDRVETLKEHMFTKRNDRDIPEMRRRAIQVAAIALRIALETCDEKSGRR